MSARVSMAVAMGYLLRRKRDAGGSASSISSPAVVRPPAPALDDEPGLGGLDRIAGPEAAPGAESSAVVQYCPKCPYPAGSIGCRNTHGGDL